MTQSDVYNNTQLFDGTSTLFNNGNQVPYTVGKIILSIYYLPKSYTRWKYIFYKFYFDFTNFVPPTQWTQCQQHSFSLGYKASYNRQAKRVCRCMHNCSITMKSRDFFWSIFSCPLLPLYFKQRPYITLYWLILRIPFFIVLYLIRIAFL